GVDRVADPRVRGRCGELPSVADADELRTQEDGVVRLVPGEPEAHAREDPAAGDVEVRAAVPECRRRDELAQREWRGRGDGRALVAVGPVRRAEDGEQDLDPRPVGGLDRLVVTAPLVRRIGRVVRMRGPLVRDPEVPAPGERQPQHLDVELLEEREGRRRRAERRGVVEQADQHPFRPGRGAGQGKRDQGEQEREPADQPSPPPARRPGKGRSNHRGRSRARPPQLTTVALSDVPAPSGRRTGFLPATVVALLVAASATAAAAPGIVRAGPVQGTSPTVTGAPTQGNRLVATPGSWQGSGPLQFRYRWYRCDTMGNSCSLLRGAAAAHHTLGVGDVGHTIAVNVRATDQSGSTNGYSSLIGPVAGKAPPLASIVQPSISGSAALGGSIEVDTGKWRPAP